MKHNILIVLTIFMSVHIHAQMNAKPFVIPSLQQWKGGTGFLQLDPQLKITYHIKDDNARKAASILISDLRETGFAQARISNKKGSNGDIQLETNAQYDAALGKEGYRFEVTNKVVIAANTYRGLFWGTRTLLQLLEQGGRKHLMAKGVAVDFPKYAVRGFMLDDGRKFFSLEFLKRYVKLLSYYKMKDFQIHLNDNGFKKYFGNNWDSTYAGFALQSSTYPALNKNGEFYTKKEFRNLQLMAQDYGINIIPEIDMPAHSLALTHAMPELGSKKYGMDHLDLNNPKVYEVADNIYKEYLSGPYPIFVGQDVHIGTDEYAKAESEKFRGFTDHLIKYVQGYGKTVSLWGALTHAQGKIPVSSKNVKMNIWYNGYADPVEMKKLGYQLISTPDGYLYIVPAAGYYYDYLNLPWLFEKWTPLQVGNVRFQDGDTSLIGGMFAVWNDIVGNGITAMDVHDRVFPALQVLSEKMWSGVTDTTDYHSFAIAAKKIGEGPRLNMLGHFSTTADSLAFYANAINKTWTDGEKISRGNLALSNVSASAFAHTFSFDHANSNIQTPIEHIGWNYRVEFDLMAIHPGILFSDSVWRTCIRLLDNGQITFSRENYADTFQYKLPFGQWNSLAFKGDNKSVSLYVNGKCQEILKGYSIPINDKDKLFRVQTLFFPLGTIGDAKHSFQGKLRQLKVICGRGNKRA